MLAFEHARHRSFPRTASGASGSTWRTRTPSSPSRSGCATARRRRAGCSRCARRSGCPRARSASSASTSATPWARRRSRRAWSTTASRCRSPSTAATTSATSPPATTTRRCARCWRAATGASAREAGKIPDLVLIDGGKGQVGTPLPFCTSWACTDVAVVGVAKGPERKPGLEELISVRGARAAARRRPSRAASDPADPRRGAPLRHRRAPRAARQGAHHFGARTRSRASARSAARRCSTRFGGLKGVRPRRSRTSPRSRASAGRSPSASTSTCTSLPA